MVTERYMLNQNGEINHFKAIHIYYSNIILYDNKLNLYVLFLRYKFSFIKRSSRLSINFLPSQGS